MELFEKASRGQYRYALVGKGVLSTEDLWNLKLEDLDKLAKGLNKELKTSQEESFITTATKSNAELENKFEIVKHIIKVKLEEKEKRALAAERSAKRAQIIELLGKKELTELESKSAEELRKELEELDY